jgi:hypothetical protein
MSARKADRPMTGIPPHSIEVRVGFDKVGRPKAAIDADKYRAVAIPLVDADMTRRLIADLQEALEHLQGGDAVVIPRSG